MGRTDDVINVAGHRLSTGRMEECLAEYPHVAECAVVGVADQLKGQSPLGLIVLKNGVDQQHELRAAFSKEGTVTAGNASGINDGAVAHLVMSEEKSKELGLTPLVTIKAYSSAGVDPAIMGTGPIPASKKCLELAGWGVNDLDLVEANEAFAAQAMSVN